MENITDPYLAKEIDQCRQRLIDGLSLKNSHQVTGQHQWVVDGTSLLSGRNYINCQ